MRKLVVSVLTSLDGYQQGPGGDLRPMPFEDAFNTHNLDLLRTAGTLVYGSTWFRENLAAWSAVAADDSASDRDKEIARRVLAMDALVISDSLSVSPEDPWAATTRVVARADGPAEIRRLKEQDGGDLLMFGSATTWNPLLEAGLVDELIVLVGAALLGDGVPFYRGGRVGLRLRSARILAPSQLVELRYAASPE
ncbi:dihydrofolate reductase family protein [uncultured Microbacterium sp.]|uniref:dihydrofolate reductase family protein n=1 Tax=uncultured Microbacterium sp. TaxID=191216 RepID=UPI0025E758D4|nr:dihydrofolate reductase family protein [uncultured Microbacterium sp.]